VVPLATPPPPSEDADILSATLDWAECTGQPCTVIAFRATVTYRLSQANGDRHASVSFVPLLVYGNCLTAFTESSPAEAPGTHTKTLSGDVEFGGCPGKAFVVDEVYGVRVYIEVAHGAQSIRSEDFPGYADIVLTR
jgi:hypothetical protein